MAVMLSMFTITPKLSLLAAGIALLNLSATAAPAVNFGPSDDLVAFDLNFQRKAQTTATIPLTQICAFDSEQPLLLKSEKYSGPSIYGGYQFTTTMSEGSLSREQIRNHQGRSDAITLQAYSGKSWEGSELSLHAVFMFKQEDFNAEYAKGNFQPESFAVKWGSYFKGSNRDVTGRYLLQIGESYYLSNFSFNVTNSGSNILPKSTLETTLWAPYSPKADLNFDQANANFQSISLENVNAVGLYIEDDQWIADGSLSSPYVLSITKFEATGLPGE